MPRWNASTTCTLRVAVREQAVGREASPTVAISRLRKPRSGGSKGGLGSILQATTRARRASRTGTALFPPLRRARRAQFSEAKTILRYKLSDSPKKCPAQNEPLDVEIILAWNAELHAKHYRRGRWH